MILANRTIKEPPQRQLSFIHVLQKFFNSRSDFFRCGGRFETFYDIAFAVDQEFGEVPFDSVAFKNFRMFFLQHRNEFRCNRMIHVEALEAFFLGQVSEERLRVVTAYVALLEHLEGNAIVDLAEFLDFFIGSRILFIELVAREAEDFRPLSLYSLYSFSRPANCGVNPHLLAVLTIRITLPLY